MCCFKVFDIDILQYFITEMKWWFTYGHHRLAVNGFLLLVNWWYFMAFYTRYNGWDKSSQITEHCRRLVDAIGLVSFRQCMERPIMITLPVTPDSRESQNLWNSVQHSCNCPLASPSSWSTSCLKRCLHVCTCTAYMNCSYVRNTCCYYVYTCVHVRAYMYARVNTV